MTLSILYLLPFTLHASELTVLINENSSLKGQFVQGGIVIGKTTPGSKVKFDKKNIRVSPEGDFIIGFNRDEPAKVNLSVMTSEGKKISKVLSVKKRKYNIQRIDGLPKSKVSPRKPEVLARIKKEGAQAANARKRDDERQDYLETFIWPTIGRISGVYGSQRVLNGQPRRPHFGVDVAAPTGTNVVAPASGVITLAHQDMFFSGGTIILDHGHGLSSTFLHLSKLLIKQGDVVKQGDLIAQVGATGRVTGAHLDWRMNLFKRRLDPQLLVPSMESVVNPDKKN
ncbi:MAG: M23 family metallopeptidase [gamma proteobacterium symbiont of Bathyaustriella thionipta]|nr:M23 family metallopeptidase [gamma proteobacterium symbiont of Bathyaustriella thionipta]MCU7950146.1 M23 family metallopeptidase [gamma proteobacterium symbiont of Bathyaustriella thionipta]MCU7952272.1 M23 family metallopeptidase [gamma proteobacterium symbiont of Bathyaustriella thionipta]MCU7965805.1 M23 family metallopeptidase [gamma proteobacterium symbiont of Bathyaustriella thionipta]